MIYQGKLQHKTKTKVTKRETKLLLFVRVNPKYIKILCVDFDLLQFYKPGECLLKINFTI